MNKEQNGSVVVGVDGSPAAAAALEWAADEAERRSVPLVIAYAGHLAHRDALAEDTAHSAMRDICAYGKELIEDAMATAVENRRLVDVRTELREMGPAEMLIELSRTAAVLVVGRGSEGPIARFVFGSVTQRVAEHAHCPVVVVGPDLPPTTTRTIVVGVSDSPGGKQAMQFACAEATACHAKVRAVRSWSELNWSRVGFPFPPDVSFETLQTGEEAILDECVRQARDAYPGLEIASVVTAQPADVGLETAARQADLLVIGCRRDDGEHRRRLGPLASWLLHHSPCPVAIVGHPAAVTKAVSTATETAFAPDHPLGLPTPQPATS
jgi:nucleotide-binding universal stress UspA family protein